MLLVALISGGTDEQKEPVMWQEAMLQDVKQLEVVWQGVMQQASGALSNLAVNDAENQVTI